MEFSCRAGGIIRGGDPEQAGLATHRGGKADNLFRRNGTDIAGPKASTATIPFNPPMAAHHHQDFMA